MSRLSYLGKKLKWALISILFVIVLNFFLFRVLPGDPARAGIRDPRLTAEAVQAIRVRYGLDRPVINCFNTLNPLRMGNCLINPFETQFFIYVSNLARGELGISYHTNRPVANMLGEALLNTLLLIGVGQVVSIFFGVMLGLVAAWKSRTVIDVSALLASLLAWSLPTFWLGIMLLFAGSAWLGLPLAGKLSIGMNYNSGWDKLVDVMRHMLLPTLTYTIIMLGEYMIIMRSTVLEVLSEDYILTAKAKGLRTGQILINHALRNALLPMVTIVALNLGFTVAGAIQIETVFSWPGLGLSVFEAVQRRDYPLLQGGFLLIAVSVIFTNLLAEMLYSYLDPRVKAG